MGLSFPLDRFDVTLDPRLPARILAIRSPAHAAEGWVLHHLEAVPGYCAALVTRGPAAFRLIRPDVRSPIQSTTHGDPCEQIGSTSSDADG